MAAARHPVQTQEAFIVGFIREIHGSQRTVDMKRYKIVSGFSNGKRTKKQS